MPPEIVPVAPVATSWLQTWLPLIGVILAFMGAVIAPTIATVINGRMANAAALKAAAQVARVEKKLAEATSKTDAKLDRIDSMVDGRLTEALDQINKLEKRLKGTSGEVEPGQSA